MALMPRSKLKGKGPAHKSKSFKKKTNKQLAAKTVTSKRKAKQRRNVDVTMMDTDTPRPAKRSGDEDDFADMALDAELPGDDAKAEAAQSLKRQAATAKAKKARRKKAPRKSAALFEATRDVAATIAEAEPQAQADWLWDNYAEHTGAAPLERGDFGGAQVASLTVAGDLEARLKAAEPRWRAEFCSDADRSPGSPSLLLIGSSAAEANALIKRLPAFNEARGVAAFSTHRGENLTCKVGKLFAKHFKVEEQQADLAKRRLAVAVGTPNRLTKLADLGALRLDRLRLIAVDVHLDAKQRTILDIPETRADFWEFFKRHWGPLLAVGQLRVALFTSTATA